MKLALSQLSIPMLAQVEPAFACHLISAILFAGLVVDFCRQVSPQERVTGHPSCRRPWDLHPFSPPL